jgi:glycosyltransferase involved in cell wall biosynthesis
MLDQDSPTAEPGTRVTVIVPVYNNARGLKTCLEALRAQTFPQSSREIVVANNGSTDDVAAVVGGFEGVRMVDEPRPGSYAARNRGIACAQGEVLAFTDADCRPEPDWIEKGVARLADAGGDVIVGGKVDVFPRDRDRATAVELYEMVTALRQRDYVERGGFAATANLFAPRSVFEQIGRFDADVKSGGDVEWGQRATSLGYRIVYAEDVRVGHPARSTLAELRSKTARVIGGVHDLRRRKTCRFLGIDRNLFFVLVPPLRHALFALRHPELETLGERLRVIRIMFFVRYLEAWERWRLRFGGTSRR